jgi:hypothetical protein
MADLKDISQYYLDRYRKNIGFANKTLGIILLVLLVNWLFSLEPGYDKLIQSRKLYRQKINNTTKELHRLQNASVSLYFKIPITKKEFKADSLILDSLYKHGHTAEELDNADDSIFNAVESYKSAVDYQFRIDTMLAHKQDSILKFKGKRKELERLRSISIKENFSSPSWESLIKFVFLIAEDPKEGSVYLMGLVLVMVVIAYAQRYFCLHFLAKATRIIKSDEALRNNIEDYAVIAPFWLAPLPNIKTIKQEEDSAENVDSPTATVPAVNGISPPHILTPPHINHDDLSLVMDWKHQVKEKGIFIFLALAILSLLQLRFIYICIDANMALQFDGMFTFGALIFVVFIAICALWAVPMVLDDHLNNEPAANNMSRRLFIAGGGVVLATIFIRMNLDSFSAVLKKNAKRFVRRGTRKTIKPDFAPGLFVRIEKKTKPAQQKKHVMLYFFDGKSDKFDGIQTPAQLVAFKSKLIKVDMHRLSDSKYLYHGIKNPEIYKFGLSDSGSRYIEKFTLAMLEINSEFAMDFIFARLVKMIEQLDTGNIRLFDLGLSIFVHFDHKVGYAEQLAKKLNGDYNHIKGLSIANRMIELGDYKIVERLRKWESGGWAPKLREKGPFKWAGKTYGNSILM